MRRNRKSRGIVRRIRRPAAKVLKSVLAVLTLAAGVVYPAHAQAVSRFIAHRSAADGIHYAHTFVAGDDRQSWRGRTPFDFIQLGMAHAACKHAQPYLSWTRLRELDVGTRKQRSRLIDRSELCEQHCPHRYLFISVHCNVKLQNLKSLHRATVNCIILTYYRTPRPVSSEFFSPPAGSAHQKRFLK